MTTKNKDSELITPVLIAGGGPVGMSLALFLARYEVPTVLLERNPTTTRHPKMDLTNGRSMEIYRQVGLVDKLREAGIPGDNAFDISWLTNMVGEELYRFKYPSANEAAAQAACDNDGSYTAEAGLRVSQIVIEPVLKAAIDAEPLIDVRFNTTFEKIISQDDSGVTVEVLDNTNDQLGQIRCQYLAGCDGGGSRVRRQLGIGLDGEMAAAGAYMVHFRSTDPEVFARWGATWHFQNAAGTIIAQNDVDIWTLQRWLIPGENPADLTPEAVLEEWVGAAFEYEILQANPWEANFVVASSYGNDRVILAGDAAHQYIPTGGYGMNSGVADAWGLSWMLAGLVQGWGGNKLVAAHEAERKTTAWWHLDAARRHFNVRIQIGDVYMAAGDLGGKGASARREAVGQKIKALGNAENESWGVEHGYRYDESPIIFHEADCPEVDPLTYVPNTCPGVRLPHVFLEPGVSLHDRLGRFFTLVVLDGTDVSAVEAAAAELAIPLTVLRLDRADLAPVYQRKLLLVRPDQHIAWRGNQLPADVFELLRVVSGR